MIWMYLLIVRGVVLAIVGDEQSANFMRSALDAPAERVTDKVTRHSYETMYGIFLDPLRHVRGLRILEIGLGCDMIYGPGSSAALWRKYLPFSELWEADIDRTCVVNSQRKGLLHGIHTLIGDQSDPAVRTSWIKTTVRPGASGGFDVIIDDGSHKNSHILSTFHDLWTKALNPGGLYFIEDLQVGRSVYYDDTRASAVMADVLSSWVEQLAIGKHRDWHADRRTINSTATRSARKRAERFRLPKFVKAVFCQEDACVVLSCSAHERVSHCVRSRRCCEKLEEARYATHPTGHHGRRYGAHALRPSPATTLSH